MRFRSSLLAAFALLAIACDESSTDTHTGVARSDEPTIDADDSSGATDEPSEPDDADDGSSQPDDDPSHEGASAGAGGNDDASDDNADDTERDGAEDSDGSIQDDSGDSAVDDASSEPEVSFAGVLDRPHQLLGGHACENRNPEWLLVDGGEANADATCALTLENAVDCHFPDPDDPGHRDVFASAATGQIVDLHVGEWVAIIDDSRTLSLWDPTTRQVTQVEGSYLQVDGSWNTVLAIDERGRGYRWRIEGTQLSFRNQLPGWHLQLTSAINRHWCSIDTAGAINCYDTNDSKAQLRQMHVAPPGGAFKQISTAERCACAIRDNDELHCWTDDTNVLEWDVFNGTPVSEVSVGSRCDLCFRPLQGETTCWRAGASARPAETLETVECQLAYR